MQAFICTACGTQYPPGDAPPAQCTICEDERQFVPLRGQTWTTLPALAAGHFNAWRQHEPGLIGIVRRSRRNRNRRCRGARLNRVDRHVRSIGGQHHGIDARQAIISAAPHRPRKPLGDDNQRLTRRTELPQFRGQGAQ